VTATWSAKGNAGTITLTAGVLSADALDPEVVLDDFQCALAFAGWGGCWVCVHPDAGAWLREMRAAAEVALEGPVRVWRNPRPFRVPPGVVS
jgi:hypothetical protein